MPCFSHADDHVEMCGKNFESIPNCNLCIPNYPKYAVYPSVQ